MVMIIGLMGKLCLIIVVVGCWLLLVDVDEKRVDAYVSLMSVGCCWLLVVVVCCLLLVVVGCCWSRLMINGLIIVGCCWMLLVVVW